MVPMEWGFTSLTLGSTRVYLHVPLGGWDSPVARPGQGLHALDGVIQVYMECSILTSNTSQASSCTRLSASTCFNTILCVCGQGLHRLSGLVLGRTDSHWQWGKASSTDAWQWIYKFLTGVLSSRTLPAALAQGFSDIRVLGRGYSGLNELRLYTTICISSLITPHQWCYTVNRLHRTTTAAEGLG